MPELPDIVTQPSAARQQIDDLIGNAPGWLLHSGITIVGLVITVILGMSAIISYPDKIVAEGIMSSSNPPIAHVNQVTGIIEHIYVENGEIVEEGEPLIYLKNDVNIKDLELLDKFIQHYESNNYIPGFLRIPFPDDLLLGDMQTEYSQLQLQFAQFQQTLRQSGVFQQLKTIDNEIDRIRELRTILVKEKAYSSEEMALIERDFNRNVTLNHEGVISDADKEKVEGEWIRFQKSYTNLDNGIIRNKITEEQLILQSQQLTEERANQVAAHQYNINQIIETLKSSILKWEKNHYVKAEIKGQVMYEPNLNKDKHVNANSNLLSIIPQAGLDSRHINAYVKHDGIGKIGINDKCILKVNAYPYKEYGTITSKVSNISRIPVSFEEIQAVEDYGYLILIEIPDTLITNHDVEIPFRPQSRVVAEIITEDKTVLHRILDTFISLINKE